MTKATRPPAALALLAFALACVHTQETEVAPTEAFSDPPTQFLDGRDTRVDLLARRLLARGEPLGATYAFHCYLLFADSSAQAEAARHGAAVAYLRLLRDVSEVRGVVKPEHMAVLFAPVKSRASAGEILGTRDVRAFLGGYDFDIARLLVNAVRRSGHDVPRVAIVGMRRPLTPDAELAKDELSIVNLDVQNESETERRVLRLRNDLEAGKTEVSQRGELVVLKLVRTFFAVVGGARDDTKEATKT
jgi:hypothetical protein